MSANNPTSENSQKTSESLEPVEAPLVAEYAKVIDVAVWKMRQQIEKQSDYELVR